MAGDEGARFAFDRRKCAVTDVHRRTLRNGGGVKTTFTGGLSAVDE